MKKLRYILFIFIFIYANNLLAFENFGGVSGIIGGAGIFYPLNSYSVFYNPAGLADINHADVTVSNAGIYGIGLKTNSFAVAYPFFDYNFTVGFGAFLQSYFDQQDDFHYNKSVYKIAVASRYSDFYWGAALKFFSHSFAAYGLDYGKGSSPSFDFSLIYKKKRVGAAVVIKDPLGIAPNYGNGVATKAKEPCLTAGLNYSIIKPFRISLSYAGGKELGAGVRYKYRLMDFYGGANLYYSDKIFIPYFALSADFKYFVISYGVNFHPQLGFQNNVSVSYNFAYKKSPIVLKKANIPDIIPSLHKTSHKNWGDVTLDNNEKFSVRGRIFFELPKAGLSFSDTFEIAPLSSKSIRIKLKFPESFFYQKEDKFYTLKIYVKANVGDKQYENSITKNFIIYSRNAFVWTDVARLSSFVLDESKNIDDIKAVIEKKLNVSPADTLKYIVSVFDFLGEMGVVYINDPINPFEKLSEMKGAIDNVQLPFETLQRGAGDCDDAVVLLCSFYQNAGISTYFVDLPGHLMLLVDSGKKNKNELGRFRPYGIKIGDEYFIPIEATKLGLSIYDSVADAFHTYQKASKKGVLHIYNVTSALKKYKRVFKNEPIKKYKFPDDNSKIFEDLKYVE